MELEFSEKQKRKYVKYYKLFNFDDHCNDHHNDKISFNSLADEFSIIIIVEIKTSTILCKVYNKFF